MEGQGLLGECCRPIFEVIARWEMISTNVDSHHLKDIFLQASSLVSAGRWEFTIRSSPVSYSPNRGFLHRSLRWHRGGILFCNLESGLEALALVHATSASARSQLDVDL
ncbi:hypothetical protein CY34DRAFT_541733 [Suillus luteus UH-Slu-Lm8-n1]|uniref:Uncharacterized protein n=1 Tax=Suillus luteus UH-Slu-Lm8-n1 TaxID=930992 RepID=A0A0D0BQJ8_9AGAM|nr:hypothetical protein CY34DRAFT_541733 [Suillus luteus UH-Slu-Lm8-n1]